MSASQAVYRHTYQGVFVMFSPRFALILCIGCMLFAWLTCFSVAAAPAVLHVAVGGDDAAAGTEEAPFRTLQRARDAIREMKGARGLPTGGVRVVIHGGVHRLNEPLALGPEDSGTAEAPIVYAGAPGERPVLSGGRVISGLRQNADGSWSTVIPEAADRKWVFRQLFINGRRYIPARSPNEGQYFIVRGVPAEEGTGRSKDSFVFKGKDIEPWDNIEDVELKVYFSWNSGTFPVKSVDPQTNIVILGGPAVWELPKPGMATCPYVVINHPGACDAPGEWQLNRETGELHIIPFGDGDEDMSAAEVVAPAFEHLVIAQGDHEEGRFVEHIRFEGLSFQHAGWNLPPEGFSTPQAASTLGAAVEFHAARHCAVIGCEVTRVGRYGIMFGMDCAHNIIQRNHLHDLGGGGIRIGTVDRPQPYERIANHHLVDNNFIHNGGHIHPGAVGIFMAYGRNNTFSHNEVSDLRYTGISLGWTWDIVRSGTRDNIVEKNHVHNVMRVLEDGGGIYSLGFTPGSVIRNNVSHTLGSRADLIGHGIYIDGGSSSLLCENNITYDCGAGGIRIQHGTSAITVINNISAFNGFGLGIDSERTNIFMYNIVCLDGSGTPFRDVAEWQSYNKIINYNLYWRYDDRPIRFLGFSWEEWREKEGIKDIWYTPRMDSHSRVADPLFADIENRDFRLLPDSPALAMGFRPIDVSDVGLYGDAEWTSLPSRYELTPIAANERGSHMLLPRDDFDDARPGQKPAFAAVVEDAENGAYLEISDQRFLSPPHSLRFVNAPDLTYYLPHMYYSPRLSGDMRLQMTFALYREPGAMLWTEWRTTAAHEKVGPCIYVEEDGRLMLNERRPTETWLPDGQWLNFEITAGLGAYSNNLWSLKITTQDGQVLFEEADLPHGPEFERLHWLGFVSNSLETAEMYIDNIEMRRLDP